MRGVPVKHLAAAICVLALPASSFGQTPCGPLPLPTGGVIDVTPAQAANLSAIIQSAQPGETIQLADGTYILPTTLVFRTPRVTLRSKSGNRAAVTLDGRYSVGDILLVTESDVTIADLTLTRAYYHPVHVVPESHSTTGTLLHNLRVVDGAEQFIKINPYNGNISDNGLIRCSSLELTDQGRTQIRNNCYTGGIDAHQARGWQVYENRFAGLWCASGLSEHAIHFWKGSRDTLVDRNVIVNSARGVGFGLGDSVPGRLYSDLPCSGKTAVGHYGGSITNNFVFANDARLFASAFGFDAGIALEQSCETNVLHNTVVSTAAPFSSIEWRFANTVAVIANNLVSHNLRPRDGALATLAGNISNASPSLFVDAVATGDLHLRPTATAAIDHAAPLTAPLAWDIDRRPRGAPADVGADEFEGTIPPAVDTVAPTVTITSPADGQTVRKSVDVKVQAADNVGVTLVELYVDGALRASSSSAPFTMKWNANSVRPGRHALQVKAYDRAGNVGGSTVMTVYR